MSSWREALADLVETRIGFRLSAEGAFDTVEHFMRARAGELGLPGPAAYIERLKQDSGDGGEFSRLTAAVTNGQTSFFRDKALFDVLADFLKLCARRSQRPVTIWSAGCSTGEEAYSLAILAAELDVATQVLATDVNEDFLRLARLGVFRRWSLRRLPRRMHTHHFEPDGDLLRVRKAIRKRVEFRTYNLLDDVSPRPGGGGSTWDLICCRNVFIYYRDPIIRRVAANLAKVLSPEGCLVLGASESLQGLDAPLCPVLFDTHILYQGRQAESKSLGQTAPGPLAQTPPPIDEAKVDASAEPPPPKREATLGTEYETAVRLIGGNSLERAQALLEGFVAKDPRNVVARLTLGNLLLRAHAFNAALEAYAAAQADNPLMAEVHYLQGVVYRKLTEWEKAADSLRRTMFLEPEFWPASYLLAGVYDRLNKPQARARELHRTLRILDGGPITSLFASEVAGMEACSLSATEVAEACRRFLAG